ncbi:hypothetical protein [Symbiobacterium thermophilum]|uniref:hypothetical protein n=1 Tax=Symbiobacterium thermophilum TaxID=2734 RepID=UPI0011D10DAC|nr:hypothetical protein [Symbiobacterium thermophilum]
MGLFLAVIGMIQLVAPEPIRQFHIVTGADPLVLSTKSNFMAGSQYNRVISFLDDPNIASQVFIAGLTAQLYLFLRRFETKWLVSVVISSSAVIATGSRSGLLSFAAALGCLLLYVWLSSNKRLKARALWAGVSGLLLLTLPLSVGNIRAIALDRFGRFGVSALAADGRLENWQQVMREVSGSIWTVLFGTGLTPGDLVTSTIVENAYLSALRDFGVIWLIVLCAAFLIAFLPIIRKSSFFGIVVLAPFLVANIFGDYTKIPLVSCWYAVMLGLSHKSGVSEA